MTVSVEVFITKSSTTYCKHVYLASLDKCDQGAVETMCIADRVLEKFSSDHPNVKKLFLKTDNAGKFVRQWLLFFDLNQILHLGSYHANGVPECMHKLAQKQGITISSYDYNEAQLVSDLLSVLKTFTTICFMFRARISATGRQLILKTVQAGGSEKTRPIK